MSILCVPGVDRPELAWQRVRAPANSDKIATTTHPGKIVVVQAARPQLSGEGYVRHARSSVQLELDGKLVAFGCG
jgi:hypothetical protein